jgi:two-component system, cell cycle sensor histidine kinase and response regulator CckA
MHIDDERSSTGKSTSNRNWRAAVADCNSDAVPNLRKIPAGGALTARLGNSVPDANAARATILFVEDEEVLRTAVATMLRKKNFKVLEAADGSMAIDLLQGYGCEISALLLDVCLPGVSSRDVLEEARRIRPAIPVMVASAFSQTTAESTFNGLSVDCFIRKPYRLAVLVELLETVLPTV